MSAKIEFCYNKRLNFRKRYTIPCLVSSHPLYELIRTGYTVVSDEEVNLEALRQGSPVEIERLLARVLSPLRIHAAIIVGDIHIAEDVVQEALIRALARIHTFEDRGPGTLDAWLRRIVINQALSTLRSVKRRREDALESFDSDYDRGVRVPKESVLAVPSAEDLVASEQTRSLVMDAIRELPEPLRLPLYLRDIEGFNTLETADILETTEGNVRTRLHRARQALKSRLEAVFGGLQS